MAVADAPETTGEDDHSDVTGHTHVTDPYLSLEHKPVDAASDSILVSWSKSYAKNFHAGNGVVATEYSVSLFAGEIPADIANPGNPLTVMSRSTGATSFVYEDADFGTGVNHVDRLYSS